MACKSQIPAIRWKVASRLRRAASGIAYSCQTALAQALHRHYDKRNDYYLWFSRELNPATVDLTSRPLHIYEDLDVAVKLGSTGHPKIRDLRLKLMRAVDLRVAAPQTKARLKVRVHQADVSWFRPVLLKIDLTGLDLSECRANAIMKGASPGEERDEYLCENVDKKNCHVIVE